MKEKVFKTFLVIVILIVVVRTIDLGIQYYEYRKEWETINKSMASIYEVCDFNEAFHLNYDVENNNDLPGVDAIDETELYIRIEVYNKKKDSYLELTTEEVTDFIKNETDTTNFEEDLPQNIRDYLSWYYHGLGSDEVSDYWNDLIDAFALYEYENPDNNCSKFSQLSLEQIQELERMTTEDDYSYSAILEGE